VFISKEQQHQKKSQEQEHEIKNYRNTFNRGGKEVTNLSDVKKEIKYSGMSKKEDGKAYQEDVNMEDTTKHYPPPSQKDFFKVDHYEGPATPDSDDHDSMMVELALNASQNLQLPAI
jgi:hypothetical protein